MKFRHTVAAIALAGCLAFGGYASGVLPALAQSIGSIFIAQNGLANAPTVYGAGASGVPTPGLYFGASFTGVTRHLANGSTDTNNIPVVTACGTTPTLATGTWRSV